jgi:hypothetical protein
MFWMRGTHARGLCGSFVNRLQLPSGSYWNLIFGFGKKRLQNIVRIFIVHYTRLFANLVLVRFYVYDSKLVTAHVESAYGPRCKIVILQHGNLSSRLLD